MSSTGEKYTLGAVRPKTKGKIRKSADGIPLGQTYRYQDKGSLLRPELGYRDGLVLPHKNPMALTYRDILFEKFAARDERIRQNTRRKRFGKRKSFRNVDASHQNCPLRAKLSLRIGSISISTDFDDAVSNDALFRIKNDGQTRDG